MIIALGLALAFSGHVAQTNFEPVALQLETMKAKPKPKPKPPAVQDLRYYLSVETDTTKPPYDGISSNPMRMRNSHPTSSLRVTYREYFWNEGVGIPNGSPTRERPQLTSKTVVVPRGGTTYLGVQSTRHKGSFVSWHRRWEVASASLAQ